MVPMISLPTCRPILYNFLIDKSLLFCQVLSATEAIDIATSVTAPRLPIIIPAKRIPFGSKFSSEPKRSRASSLLKPLN